MTDSLNTGFEKFRVQELRRLERAQEVYIQSLHIFLNDADHKNNVVFLTLASEGLGMKFKQDYIKAEISAANILLDRIKTEMLRR